MILSDILLIIFGLIAVVAAAWILFTKNLIHAALMLVVVLLSIAAIYVIYSALFLAVVQILVYAGGIVVLLAFGIMLTRRSDKEKLVSGFHLVFPGMVIFVLVAGIFTYIAGSRSFRNFSYESQQDQVRQIGMAFMTDYILAFELVAYLLLVVLIGAAYLAKQSRS